MIKHLFNFLKGICIGIANVIPGFSGGTMAVMLKVYDLFVYGFANIFNDFKNVIKNCWSLFVGILAGVLIALVSIVKLLEVIPFITIMFFVGLILGSIPSIASKAKQGKLKFYDIIGLVIAIAIMVLLPLLQTSNDTTMTYSFWLYIIMFLMGVICSSAMVIPGVSGSLVLMAFGYYAFFMYTMKDFIVNIFNFSYTNYWNNFFIILSFAIGCILGIVFISKLIIKLTSKYPKTVYFTILGLLLASPFSIIFATLKDYNVIFDLPTILFSILSLILGVVVILLGEYFTKKHKTNIEVDK